MSSFRQAAIYITVLLYLGLSSASRSAADQDAANTQVDFAREVLPVLAEKCFICHGPDGTDSDILRLDSYDAATADLGGYQAVNPDTPGDSEILKRIESSDDPMPPEDAEKQLTDSERAVLQRWIHQGGQYATHWAFARPEKVAPPNSDGGSASQIVDAFVHAELRGKGLDFAPEADRATLARRAALVLTGLPPEPDQLRTFLDDKRPDAYERLVDELLDSPRYGEHQARYWLDAVRYGDTHGLHLDNRRGIYPYRNWVIHALNRNLPLNTFLTWQLAGDLLPDANLETRVATGFVRMNPSTAEGGVIPEEFQAKNNFDRVETLGTVLIGMTLTCARCHTHKYDPIPQTEYYRLLAFFNSTAEKPLDGNKYEYAPAIPAPADVESWTKLAAIESQQQILLAEADKAMKQVVGVEQDAIAGWEQGDREQRWKMITDPNGPLAAQANHQQAIDLTEQLEALQSAFTSTLVAQELPKPRETRLLERGEYDMATGEPLEPGVPSVMGEFPDNAPRNRLGLAKWLTSREHPLVARVLVNRMWQRVFGRGLVRTPEDFGLQGEQPTHPELLDWLAVELHDSQWDLKHMLRIMVHSKTFRQHSGWRPDVDDPENRLLARGPRFRLDAEVIRDIGLWSSGLLDPTMGGEGVKPYQPDGMWSALMHPASNTKKYERDKGRKLYRRSLYVYWKRTCPHPMLTLFDAPSREVSCVRRSRSTTPVQSLALLNETQRVEMARMLAEQLLHEHPHDTARLNHVFTLLSCRHPTENELAVCSQMLNTMRTRYREAEGDATRLLSVGEAPRDEQLDPAEHAAWTQLAATLLASDLALMLY